MSNRFFKHFGEALREARQDAGIAPLELADAADAHRHSHPSGIARLAKALGVEFRCSEHGWSTGPVGEANELREKIDDWKCASGLIGSSGDPADIEPEHMEADLREREREADELREGLVKAIDLVNSALMPDGWTEEEQEELADLRKLAGLEG